MRIGVFGGALDPVHYGHLILAEPTAAPSDRRVEMLRLATAGHPVFRVAEIERDRPGLSYTADTLDGLRRDHPGDDLFLLVGSDTLSEFAQWHAPDRIMRAAALVVME